MKPDIPPGGSAEPGGQVGRGRPARTIGDNVRPALDMTFDLGALPAVREKIRACAIQFGLPEEQARDMTLAVHELTTNAVVHGGGTGRLRLWRLDKAFQCQVDDGDFMGFPVGGAERSGTGNIPLDDATVTSLPRPAGHGLSVVSQLSDQLESLSGRHGTRVRITFGFPAEFH